MVALVVAASIMGRFGSFYWRGGFTANFVLWQGLSTAALFIDANQCREDNCNQQVRILISQVECMFDLPSVARHGGNFPDIDSTNVRLSSWKRKIFTFSTFRLKVCLSWFSCLCIVSIYSHLRERKYINIKKPEESMRFPHFLIS